MAGDTYSWDPSSTCADGRAVWMEEPPGQVFVADEGGTLVGSAQLHPNYGPASRIANASYIVDPRCSGRGIGRQLVQFTLDEARRRGYRAMVFNAVVETNANAVHLYRSMGFTILATVPEAFDHPRLGYVGLHIMYLRL